MAKEENEPDQEDQGRRDLLAINLILQLEPKLHSDTTGQPYIELPIEQIPSDGANAATAATRPWPIWHGRVKAEIATLLYSRRGIILFDHEINRILRILEGMAHREPRGEIGIKELIDENPLIEAVYILLCQPDVTGRFEKSGTELLTALNTIAGLKGIDNQSKYWPQGVAQLSKRLADLSDQLGKAGITFQRGRRPGGDRYIILCLKQSQEDERHCGDANRSASQPPSNDKSQQHQEFHSGDALDDGIMQRLNSISTTPPGRTFS